MNAYYGPWEILDAMQASLAGRETASPAKKSRLFPLAEFAAGDHGEAASRASLSAGGCPLRRPFRIKLRRRFQRLPGKL